MKPKVEFKNIRDFEKEQKEKRALEEKPVVEKKPFLTKSGKFKCCHKGCLKEFSDEDN